MWKSIVFMIYQKFCLSCKLWNTMVFNLNIEEYHDLQFYNSACELDVFVKSKLSFSLSFIYFLYILVVCFPYFHKSHFIILISQHMIYRLKIKLKVWHRIIIKIIGKFVGNDFNIMIYDNIEIIDQSSTIYNQYEHNHILKPHLALIFFLIKTFCL